VVAHLIWQDVKHNLRPIRALPLLLFSQGFIYSRVEGPMDSRVTHVQGALSFFGGWIFLLMIPIIAAVMGGGLAAERRTGVALSVLGKGVTRRDYVYGKLFGAAASSAIMIGASILGFFIIVSILWPMDRTTWEASDWPGPFPQLFNENPLALDLIRIPMYLVAAAALPMIGILAGVIVANEYVAMAMTPIVVILWTLIMRNVSRLLNPEEYLDLGYYFYWGPHFRWLIPFAPFLFWGTFAFIISFICQRIFAKKEIG
jgi:hypothetical protein